MGELRMVAGGPKGRLEHYVRANGRSPYEEFREASALPLWERFQRVFARFLDEGLAIAGNGVFKPLTGRGKGIWEFKQFDHRLYAFRGPDYGKAARLVLLNGWIKDKDASIGAGIEENRQIEKAIAMKAECLAAVAWAEATPEPVAPASAQEPSSGTEDEDVDGDEIEMPQPTTERPGYLDLVAVTKCLGVQRKRLRRWIERGQLSPDFDDGKTVWWAKENIEALAERVAKLQAAAGKQQPEPPGLAEPEEPRGMEEEPPADGTHLSTREVAARLGISKDALIRAIGKGVISPDGRRSWRGPNPCYVWKEESLPGLFEKLNEHAKGGGMAAPAMQGTTPPAALTKQQLLTLAEEVIDGKAKPREFTDKLAEYRRYAGWLEAELKRMRG